MRDNLIWNGIIQSFVMTYLKNFVTFYLALQLIKYQSDGNLTFGVVATTILTGLPIIIFPFWSFFFLLYNKNRLQEAEFKDKFRVLYSDLKQNFTHHSPQILMYPLIFSLRRASYVVMALLDFPSIIFNLMLHIGLSVAYFAWIEHFKPFSNPRNR